MSSDKPAPASFKALCAAAEAAAAARDWPAALAAADAAALLAHAAPPREHAAVTATLPCGALLAVAEAHDALGASDRAIEALDALLQQNPSHAEALWRRAQLQERAGGWQAAFLDLHALQALGTPGRPGLLEALQRTAAACRRAREMGRSCAQAAAAAGAAAGGGGRGGQGGFERVRRGGLGPGSAPPALAAHLALLGLSSGGRLVGGLPSVAQVRAAYKRLAACWHPDKAAPAERAAAGERFKEMQAAYRAVMEAVGAA